METGVTIVSSAAEAVTGIVSSLGSAATGLITNDGLREVAGIGLAVFIVGTVIGLIPFLKRKRR